VEVIHLFYNKIYRGKRANRPTVSDPDQTSWIKDPDLKKIIKSGVEDTHYNNEACFFLDSVAQSYAYIVAYTIIGDGLKVTVPGKEKEEELIRTFNNKINLHDDTIDDYIIDKTIDNFIYGYDLWRVQKEAEIVDLQRISPKTIQIKHDPVHGWRKFVQRQSGRNTYPTYEAFLKEQIHLRKADAAYVNIPDDPHVCIYSAFFRKAPMAAVNHLIVYKRWILMFLRKYAERMWAPSRVGYVGDPKTNFMPTGPEEMQVSLQLLSDSMLQLRNFSNVAIPGNYRIETEDIKNNGDVYLQYIDMLNEEIMFGLFGSMGMRRTTTTWKSNNLVDEAAVHVMDGIRREIETALRRLYIANITPDVKANEIIFHWSPLRSSSIQEYTNAIESLTKIGAFKDMHEVRRASSIVFPFLAETELTEPEAKKLFDFLVLMNAPSQKEETTPNVINKSRKSTKTNK
jgi:hypothetical protein